MPCHIIPHSTVSCFNPQPHILQDWACALLFATVTSDTLFKIIHLLLTEKSLIVYGSDKGYVTAISLAVMELLKPFSWQVHHITLHHITQHHIHYITLHCTASHYTASHYTASHYITLHHITLHHITLHHITLHHITLHHITLHHITLHHITLHHTSYYMYITSHYIAVQCSREVK